MMEKKLELQLLVAIAIFAREKSLLETEVDKRTILINTAPGGISGRKETT